MGDMSGGGGSSDNDTGDDNDQQMSSLDNRYVPSDDLAMGKFTANSTPAPAVSNDSGGGDKGGDEAMGDDDTDTFDAMGGYDDREVGDVDYIAEPAVSSSTPSGVSGDDPYDDGGGKGGGSNTAPADTTPSSAGDVWGDDDQSGVPSYVHWQNPDDSGGNQIVPTGGSGVDTSSISGIEAASTPSGVSGDDPYDDGGGVKGGDVVFGEPEDTTPSAVSSSFNNPNDNTSIFQEGQTSTLGLGDEYNRLDFVEGKYATKNDKALVENAGWILDQDSGVAMPPPGEQGDSEFAGTNLPPQQYINDGSDYTPDDNQQNQQNQQYINDGSDYTPTDDSGAENNETTGTQNTDTGDDTVTKSWLQQVLDGDKGGDGEGQIGPANLTGNDDGGGGNQMSGTDGANDGTDGTQGTQGTDGTDGTGEDGEEGEGETPTGGVSINDEGLVVNADGTPYNGVITIGGITYDIVDGVATAREEGEGEDDGDGTTTGGEDGGLNPDTNNDGTITSLEQEIADLRSQLANLTGNSTTETEGMTREDIMAAINEAMQQYGGGGYMPLSFLNAFGASTMPSYFGNTIPSWISPDGVYERRAVKDKDTGEMRFINVPIGNASLAGTGGFQAERRAGFGNNVFL